jgi:hypothetical protein
MTTAVTIAGRTGTFLSIVPAIGGVVIASVSSVAIWHVSNTDGYNLGALYAGVLGLLAIFAGFLATFYVFVATRSNAFLSAIRGTATFRQLVALLRFTLIWTIGTCAMTLVVSVIEPRNFELLSLAGLFVAMWTWSVSMIVLNFWRCSRMFIRIVEAETH